MKPYEIVCLEGVPEQKRLFCLSLQGILNREEPRLYFLDRENGPERHWIDWYRGYGLEGETISTDTLIEKHASIARGYILFDPECGESANAALSLAGIEDAVIAPPSLTGRLEKQGLSILADLRNRWDRPYEAAAWAVEQIMPRCDLHTLGTYDQAERLRGFPTMDLLSARKGFCLGMTINDADFPKEAALWEKVQERAPDHAMMIGWHTPRGSEATYVHFASSHNVRVFCGFAWNMSFHVHVRARGDYNQDHPAGESCDPEGRYATLVLSDGDAWHSMCDVQKKFWLHPRRGEFPLGWEVSPSFAELAPAVLEYYYRTRGENDCLVCGPSGNGYNYMSAYEKREEYLRESARLLETLSIDTIWTINRVVRHLPGGVIEHLLRDGPTGYTRAQMEEFGGIKDEKGADLVDPEVIGDYMRIFHDAPGFFQGWERIPGEAPRWIEERVWCPTGALVRGSAEESIGHFERAAGEQCRPAFVSAHVNCWDADMDMVIETIQGLKRRGFELLRPDVFLETARGAPHKGHTN